MTTTLGDTIREIVKSAQEQGQDTITAIMDYFHDKDSRITREQAKRYLWMCCGVTA